jgi:hypothetical protein
MLNSYRLLRNSESTLSLHNCFPSHQPSPNKNNKIEFISPINGNQSIPKNILYTPQTNKFIKDNYFNYYNSLNESDVLNNSNSAIKINDVFNKRKYPLINFHRSKSNHSLSPLFAYSQLKAPDIYRFHSKLIEPTRKKYLLRNNSLKNIINPKKLFNELLDDNNNNELEDKQNNIESDDVNNNNNSKQNNISNTDKQKEFFIKQKKRFLFNQKFFIKKTSPDCRKILTHEIIQAKGKLGLNKQNHPYNEMQLPKRIDKPLIIRHLERYFYIRKKNPLLEINNEGKLPAMLDDGAYMQMLLNDEFHNIKVDKLNSLIEKTKEK